jgi:branched-subunit amino acid aminotransferase/4-amino-4-deoxychorismate lyase
MTGPVNRQIWIDGEFRPWADAQVHVLSHSLQRGSLVFDYMSVHGSSRGAAVFRLREHVQRFLRSVELVGLPLDAKPAALEAAILETVRRNPGATAVKICAYLPSIEVDVVPLDEHVAVAIAAYDPGADVIAYKPVKPRVSPLLRLWIERSSATAATTSWRRRRRSPRTTRRRCWRSGARAAAATTTSCSSTSRETSPRRRPPTSSWWTARARS